MAIKETDEILKLNFLERSIMKKLIKRSRKNLAKVKEAKELKSAEELKTRLIKGLVEMSEILDIRDNCADKELLEPDFLLLEIPQLAEIYEESINALEKMLGK